MNASKILQQLMNQASGGKGGRGGMDVQGIMDGLSRQLGGSGSQAARSGGSSGGFDMKSLLGG
ncbi:tellurite resistance TerB family protein, partial [Sharpea azabuensis]